MANELGLPWIYYQNILFSEAVNQSILLFASKTYNTAVMLCCILGEPSPITHAATSTRARNGREFDLWRMALEAGLFIDMWQNYFRSGIQTWFLQKENKQEKWRFSTKFSNFLESEIKVFVTMQKQRKYFFQQNSSVSIVHVSTFQSAAKRCFSPLKQSPKKPSSFF